MTEDDPREATFWKALEESDDPPRLGVFADYLQERGWLHDEELAYTLRWMQDRDRRPYPRNWPEAYRKWGWFQDMGNEALPTYFPEEDRQAYQHHPRARLPSPLFLAMNTNLAHLGRHRTFQDAVLALDRGLWRLIRISHLDLPLSRPW